MGTLRLSVPDSALHSPTHGEQPELSSPKVSLAMPRSSVAQNLRDSLFVGITAAPPSPQQFCGSELSLPTQLFTRDLPLSV